MKSLRVALLATTAVLGFMTVHAQTADEVIDKYFEALGGKEKISSINTIYIESDVDIMGNQAPNIVYIVNGKGYRSELDFGGQQVIQVATDKGGWVLNPLAGQTEPVPMTEEQVKANQSQLHIGGPLLNYAEKGNKVELLGKEDVQGVSAHKLKAVASEGNEFLFFLHPETYHLLKTVSKITMEGQELETTITYSDYKMTDYGNLMAYSTEIILPQGITLNMTTKKVEVNKDIDIKIFEMQ